MTKMIHVLSNGNGEDQIASNLILALQKADPELQCKAFPLVGLGLEYKKKNITPGFQNPTMPSGGFIRSLKTAWKDLQQGVFQTHLIQRKRLKKQSHEADLALCVGDVFCLIMGKLAGYKKIVFLPTAKSDTFMTHSLVEKRLIKKWASLVFTRDELTKTSLSKAKINAHFEGNPMFDGLIPTGNTFGIPKEQLTIALLPGSRDEALSNLRYLLSCIPTLLSKLPQTHFIIAKAPTVSFDTLHIPFEQVTVGEHFPDVIANCHVVIGLSGTANEQAITLGKQVLCFEGFGPQSTKQRFVEQQKMMGPALHILEDRSPDAIANALEELIQKFHPEKGLNSNPENASMKIAKQILALLKR